MKLNELVKTLKYLQERGCGEKEVMMHINIYNIDELTTIENYKLTNYKFRDGEDKEIIILLP